MKTFFHFSDGAFLSEVSLCICGPVRSSPRYFDCECFGFSLFFFFFFFFFF